MLNLDRTGRIAGILNVLGGLLAAGGFIFSGLGEAFFQNRDPALWVRATMLLPFLTLSGAVVLTFLSWKADPPALRRLRLAVGLSAVAWLGFPFYFLEPLPRLLLMFALLAGFPIFSWKILPAETAKAKKLKLINICFVGILSVPFILPEPARDLAVIAFPASVLASIVFFILAKRADLTPARRIPLAFFGVQIEFLLGFFQLHHAIFILGPLAALPASVILLIWAVSRGAGPLWVVISVSISILLEVLFLAVVGMIAAGLAH